MRAFQLFAIPLALAICVSTVFGQETETKVSDEDLAKAAKMLHGMWKGDAEKTAEAIKKMDDLDLDENMIEMMLEQVGSIEVDFQDGDFHVIMGDREINGEWKVTKVKKKGEATILNIHTIADEGAGGEEKNFEIHFMGKTHMKMVDLDQGGPPIVMQRKKEEKKDN